jgi:hypothetical protein
VYDLMALANDTTTLPGVRATATAELHFYKEKNATEFKPRSAENEVEVYSAFVARQIEEFEKDPTKVIATMPYEPPDGPPIGDDEDF